MSTLNKPWESGGHERPAQTSNEIAADKPNDRLPATAFFLRLHGKCNSVYPPQWVTSDGYSRTLANAIVLVTGDCITIHKSDEIFSSDPNPERLPVLPERTDEETIAHRMVYVGKKPFLRLQDDIQILESGRLNGRRSPAVYYDFSTHHLIGELPPEKNKAA